jgi:methylmalonyl-CoA/ethylmalonyl-CoA epimerase
LSSANPERTSGMIKKIDHVGLVVQSTDETLALFSRLFGFEISESRTEPEAGFKSTRVSKADVMLELIEPVGAQGMIQKFVEKRGGGLHHISIEVSDLEAEMKRLKTQGVQFSSEEPASVGGNKVIFIHPRSVNGLLIELTQKT